MKKVVRVSISSKAYGGNFYEECIDQAFISQPGVDYQVLRLRFKLPSIFKVLELPSKIFAIWSAQKKGTTLIVNFVTLPLVPFLKNSLTIVHHIDSTGASLTSKIYQMIAEGIFRFVYSKDNRIIVVAEYWKNIAITAGFTDVKVIYNPFDIARYDAVSREQVANFRYKHNLQLHTEIVYVGNPLPQKGYPEVVNTLSYKPYILISTGEGRPDEKARYLKLTFADYVCLLKEAKAVITFSQFKEGWCRVAHEAMILGTPVIGSGSGGMGELLGQNRGIVATSAEQILQALETPRSNESLKHAQDYARSFTIERFCKCWREVLP